LRRWIAAISRAGGENFTLFAHPSLGLAIVVAHVDAVAHFQQTFLIILSILFLSESITDRSETFLLKVLT
jgi:hypothetical protein